MPLKTNPIHEKPSFFDEPALRANLQQHLDNIREFGAVPGKSGSTRLVYTPQEDACFDYIRTQAEAHGLNVREDAVGNLIIDYPLKLAPQKGKRVVVDSHLDSVPDGGIYDGVVGIISALEAMKALIRKGIRLKKRLSLYVFRGEESSRFNKAYLGSLAVSGNPPPLELRDTLAGNKTLRQVLAERLYNRITQNPGHELVPGILSILGKESVDQVTEEEIGAKMDEIIRRLAAIDMEEIEHAFEVHIDQSDLLEKKEAKMKKRGILEKTPLLGMVTHIAAPERALATFRGPEAITATMEAVRRIDELARKLAEKSPEDGSAVSGRIGRLFRTADRVPFIGGVLRKAKPAKSLTGTIGRVSTSPEGLSIPDGAINKISSNVELTFTPKKGFDISTIKDIVPPDCELEQLPGGKIRVLVTAKGGHSGAVPMYSREDADALVRVAQIFPKLKQYIEEPETSVNFSLDVRGINDRYRSAATQKVLEILKDIATSNGVRLSGESKSKKPSPAIQMNPQRVGFAKRVAEIEGYPTTELTCGAGHDLTIFGDKGALIFIKKKGESHTPSEEAELEDIVGASKYLTSLLANAAGIVRA